MIGATDSPDACNYLLRHLKREDTATQNAK